MVIGYIKPPSLALPLRLTFPVDGKQDKQLKHYSMGFVQRRQATFKMCLTSCNINFVSTFIQQFVNSAKKMLKAC